MKEDFFDWLDDCPVHWVLKDDDENGRTYLFIDNDDEEETEEEGEIAIMDDKGIIEDCFRDEEEAINSLDRVREENDDIVGDLKIIQILGSYN
jgi:hypothetical protein